MSLEEKARIFLSVISEMESIISPNFSSEKDKQPFSDRMRKYEEECIALRDGKVHQPKRQSSAVDQSYELIIKLDDKQEFQQNHSEAENIYALDESVKRFIHAVVMFFEGFNSDIDAKRKILTALRASIKKSDIPEGTKKFLQNIYVQLNSQELLSRLDKYHTKIAAFLDLHFFAQIIYRDMDLFSFFSEEPVSKTPLIDGTKLEANLRRSLSFLGSQKQLAVELVLSREEVYANIIPKIPNDKDASIEENKKKDAVEIKYIFSELLDKEKTRSETLITIQKELQRIIEHLEHMLTLAEKELISGFMKKLGPLLNLQEEFIKRIEEKLLDFNFVLDIQIEAKKKNEPISEEDRLNVRKKAALCFVDIFEKSFLERQAEISGPLKDDLEKIEVILNLRKNKDECEKIRSELPIISGQFAYSLEVLFLHIVQKRETIAEKMFNLFEFSEFEKNAIEEYYKGIFYVTKRDDLKRALKEDGYVPPVEFAGMLKVHMNEETGYSLCYFLVSSECNDMVRQAFVTFAQNKFGATIELKLKFFKEAYEILHKKPLLLQDIKPLRAYVRDNPLGLSSDVLRILKTALELQVDNANAHFKIKKIVEALIPTVTAVSLELNAILKEFQYSVDAVEILLYVPEIKNKLHGSHTLSALNKNDIELLPGFWKTIFTDENSALRKFFNKKKDELISSRNPPPPTLLDAIDKLIDTNLKMSNDNSKEVELSFDERVKQEFRKQFKLAVDKSIEDMSVVVDAVLKALIEEEFYLYIKRFLAEKLLHRDCLGILVRDKGKICRATLKKFKEFNQSKDITVYNTMLALFNVDSKNQNFIVSAGAEVTAKTPAQIGVSSEFCSVVKDAFVEFIADELKRRIKLIENKNMIAIERNIAEELLEREFSRQIELLRDACIFSEVVLTAMVMKRKEILEPVLKKIRKQKTPELLMKRYVSALLRVPYYLIAALPHSFSEDILERKVIFSSDFLKKLEVAQVEPDLESFKAFIAKQRHQYFEQNKVVLRSIDSAASTFRLFNAVCNKADPTVYTRLGEDLCNSGIKPVKSSSSISLMPKTPRKEKLLPGRRPKSATAGVELNAMFASPEKTTVASCASPIHFETFVEGVERKIADKNEQWRMEKYIKSRNEVTAKDDLIPDVLTADCNFIAVYEQKEEEKKELIFTAEKKTDNAMEGSSTSLPIKERCIVKSYRHGHDDVAMIVSAMAESVPSLESAPLGARRVLKINLTALPEDELPLIVEYVDVALDKGFFPKVTLNNDTVPLTPQALYDKLKQQAPSLAITYKKEFEQQKKICLGQNGQAFLRGPSSNTRPLDTNLEVKKRPISSVSRPLSFDNGG